jgi:Zinc-binding dehydrogenase
MKSVDADSLGQTRPGALVEMGEPVQRPADGDRLAQLACMNDDGRLTVEIQDIFPFDRVPDALEVVQVEHVAGKVVPKIA